MLTSILRVDQVRADGPPVQSADDGDDVGTVRSDQSLRIGGLRLNLKDLNMILNLLL